ncbi:MAG: phosphoribosyltransferase [Spirochaeta sp.]
MKFTNRKDGGEKLAEKLSAYADIAGVIVLGLPRGGVPVAGEVARRLHAPLDVFLVRKIGTPGREELAMGAIASGGSRVLNQNVISQLNISEEDIRRVENEERAELERREREYRGGRDELDLKGKTVILVDDGLATGASMKAAVAAVKKLQPQRVIVAVPAAAPDSMRALQAEADDVVAVITPEPYMAVGAWYEDFNQTSDAEVKRILESAG